MVITGAESGPWAAYATYLTIWLYMLIPDMFDENATYVRAFMEMKILLQTSSEAIVFRNYVGGV